MYSTSANEHNKIFNEDFSILKCDVILYDNIDFKENSSSTIYKISKNNIKKIR
jgi:hypothetical protein